MTIKTKIASVAVAAAMAVSATAANADTYTIPLVNGVGSVTVTNPGNAGNTTRLRPFSDTFLFSIPTAGLVSGFIISFGANASNTNVNFGPQLAVTSGPYRAPAVAGAPTYGTVGGTRTPLTVNNTGFLENLSFSNVLLQAGSYSIDVPGVSQNLGSYTVSVSYLAQVATVPEAGTWAMMILGLGATGAALRVRRRKVSFAAA